MASRRATATLMSTSACWRQCAKFCSLVAAGDIAVGRGLALALADWFPGHSDYMDAALATWVMKKVANGAPVPLRRVMRGITSIAGHAGEPGVRVEEEVDTGGTPCQ